jgi:glycosyltransferase involved in cell wall biosynthesis
MHRLTRRWRRAILGHAAAIIANSEGLAATSRAADPFPVQIIPTGVDAEQFHPGPESGSHPAGAPLRLLFVGRVHREKNLAIVLRQMASLPPHVRAQVELQVAGDGAQRPELELLARELGLTARVRWLGWQAKHAIPALYRSADVLLNPAQYEGLPNVALEAMASGLPVMASDVPGNRAVVQDGKTGVLFPLDRPDQLGAALSRLAADRSWGRSLGMAGRQRAESEFSWRKAAQSYLELLPAFQPR